MKFLFHFPHSTDNKSCMIIEQDLCVSMVPQQLPGFVLIFQDSVIIKPTSHLEKVMEFHTLCLQIKG